MHSEAGSEGAGLRGRSEGRVFRGAGTAGGRGCEVRGWASVGGCLAAGQRDSIYLLKRSLAAFGKWTVGRQRWKTKGLLGFRHTQILDCESCGGNVGGGAGEAHLKRLPCASVH